MRKTLCALSLCLPLLIASCGKKKNASPDTPYPQTITGVQLRTIDANPAGVLGTLDTKTKSDSFSMAIYPTPCDNQMTVFVGISNMIPLKVDAKLVAVTFAGAPQTYPSYNNPAKPVVIENEKFAGTVVSSLSQNIDIAPVDTFSGGIQPVPGGTGSGSQRSQSLLFTFDVTNMPQGFYRVYIETSDGKSFWDNGWIWRQ